MSTQAGRFTSGNVVIEKQSIGSVGAVNNSQGALEASDFPGGTASFYLRIFKHGFCCRCRC